MRMNENIFIGFGFVVGCVLGFVVGVTIGAIEITPLTTLMLKDGRLQWETLTGSFLALFAAGITFYAMRWQANEQIRRKRRAAFATLPLMLSELIDQNVKCFDILKLLLGSTNKGIVNRNYTKLNLNEIVLPKLPDGSAEIIK